jgi:ABC-type branched-subunit amino acid transport system substrate-binding protein
VRRIAPLLAAVSAAAVVALVALATVPAASGASTAVRGFDGTTLKVAGFGIKAQLPTSETGARARVERFNRDGEIKGLKLEYVEFADDKQDPATALTEGRRLVTQDQVFAIVGDVSQFNPSEYFAQQQVPYFGWAFDNSYCSHDPSTKLWGFGYTGCIVPSDPSFIGASGMNLYAYAQEKTGKQHPTLAIVGNDSVSSRASMRLAKIYYPKAGFDVVGTFNQMPDPPIADYTPFAQAALTADGGKAPDVIVCALATDCIPLYANIRANRYAGIYVSSLYSNLLVKSMQGSLVQTEFGNPIDSSPGMDRMKADLEAIQPGSGDEIDSGTIAGYSSTDMFIQALKTVAKRGKAAITPANVQAAAARQTWRLEGVAGPTKYPDATVTTVQTCGALFLSDGTQWMTQEPFVCTAKRYRVPPGS